MPVEIIGEFGTPGAEREWIVAECELAIKHLVKVCGEPPPEMKLEIQWQEHDLGEYPTIVLTWEDAMRGAPWNYISRCEAALTAYENGGELPPGWTMPPVRSEDDDPNEPFDPDEPPPESPETLNVLEHQRYISKLIHWGFEASKRERSRPHLLERDDDPESESYLLSDMPVSPRTPPAGGRTRTGRPLPREFRFCVPVSGPPVLGKPGTETLPSLNIWLRLTGDASML